MLLDPAYRSLMAMVTATGEAVGSVPGGQEPAPGLHFRLMTPLFTEVDKVTMTFARDVSSRLIAEIAPVVSAGLALWFVVWGVLIIRGAVEQPVTDFLSHAIRIALIVSVALNAGFYQSTVAELVRSLPDELARVVMGGERGMEGAPPALASDVNAATSRSAQAAVIDRAVGLGLAKSGDAFEKAGVFSGQGVGFALLGMILLLATVAMGGIGGAFILMAKATLAILAALGPLFIAALLFERTKHFFQNWLAMVATYGLVVVVIASVFTFLLAIFGNYMNGVSFDGVLNIAYAVGGSAILALVSILVLLEVKTVAVGLGGGHAHEMGRGLLLYFMTLKFLNRSQLRRPAPPPSPSPKNNGSPPGSASGYARALSPPRPPPSGSGGPRGATPGASPSAAGRLVPGPNRAPPSSSLKARPSSGGRSDNAGGARGIGVEERSVATRRAHGAPAPVHGERVGRTRRSDVLASSGASQAGAPLPEGKS